jgi:hypothetical protein
VYLVTRLGGRESLIRSADGWRIKRRVGAKGACVERAVEAKEACRWLLTTGNENDLPPELMALAGEFEI